MPQTKRPPGGAGGRRGSSLRITKPTIEPIAAAPQAQTEVFVEHSAHSAFSVTLTRDRGRIITTTFAKVHGAWRAVGQPASLPAILLDTAIDALQALRDAMERGR